mgnify:CR=1 FL=1
MKNIIESIKKLFAFKKSMIAILMIVSLLLTTGTFSYWALSVQGDYDETTMTFGIGEYLTTLFDFVLNEENITFQYEVDIDYLIEDYKNNKDEVLFGIVWNDPNLSEEFKDRVVNGDIDVQYELKFYENGVEVNSKIERTLSRLLKLKVDKNNPDTITYGSRAETFEFYMMMNSRKSLSQVTELLEYQVFVEITYSINY